MRLYCLQKSLVIALTSADLHREVDYVLLCLPCLKLFRCARFTNRFAEPLPGLRIPAGLAAVLAAVTGERH